MKWGIAVTMVLMLPGMGGARAQAPAPAQAQESPEVQRLEIPPGSRRPVVLGRPDSAQQVLRLRRRLFELDRLLALGSEAAAEALITDLEQHSALANDLVSRRVLLAQLKGDYEGAITLSREALARRPRTVGLWRQLAKSYLAASQPDSARLALQTFIGLTPNRQSGTTVATGLCLDAGFPGLAVGLIDSMRLALNTPRLLRRQRALGLLALRRDEEAAAEISAELRLNPYNYSMVRAELLEGPYQPGEHPVFLAKLTDFAKEPRAEGGEALLVANLLVYAGRVPEALALVKPLYRTPNLVMVLLQNSQIITSELRLLTDPAHVQAAVEYQVGVLGELCTATGVALMSRRRAADYLATVCETALELDALGPNPEESAARFGDLLQVVARINPASAHLYSSQIELALYLRDRLYRPAEAARRLEQMLLNPDLPVAGLAVVRLSLGQSYLAAGDTARGRVVLTSLGRDANFKEAAGHAHYLLAQLDLAEGYFATARDRFAVVALDNPGASYANESLDLGLIIAEEMENPSGGPDILALYAPVVYTGLTTQPMAQVRALERFVNEAGKRLDLDEPQHLLEKARFDLAIAYGDNGRLDEALPLLQTVVLEHPQGRYPARALHRRGELLAASGRSIAARAAWEQMLVQYPDYLFIDDVRDLLRGMPNQ